MKHKEVEGQKPARRQAFQTFMQIGQAAQARAPLNRLGCTSVY